MAPMMDWTDRHDRYFLRLISPDILLYTEMITAHAIAYGDVEHLLSFHPLEHPIVLQLGGSDPLMLSHASKIGASFGYDEINLNVGCPSPRVSSGRFGACLMREPQLVADCISAMQDSVNVPITVKCRIGVDENDSYSALCDFIQHVVNAGCHTFIIHARKALLAALSPKENREIPPLRYEVVRQLKNDFPESCIILNGGIQTIEAIEQELPFVDGIMIGRAAYTNPYFLSEVQAKYFSSANFKSRREIIQTFIPYISEQMQNKVKLSAITRHILGLYKGQRGAGAWRRYISQHAYQIGAGIEVLHRALELME